MAEAAPLSYVMKLHHALADCFRTGINDHAWYRISSYLHSAAAQGYKPLTAILIALAGNAVYLIDVVEQAQRQITSQKKRASSYL